MLFWVACFPDDSPARAAPRVLLDVNLIVGFASLAIGVLFGVFCKHTKTIVFQQRFYKGDRIGAFEK